MPDETAPNSEEQLRAILRKFFRKMEKHLLSPVLEHWLENLTGQLFIIVQMLKQERRRRHRSRGYRELCRHILELCEGPLPKELTSLDPEQLKTMDKFLNGMIRSLTRKPRKPVVDPRKFIALQKGIFVRPGKRGPKNRRMFDEAYRRSKRGEQVSAIAHDLAPEALAADPANTIQRFSNAIRRRERDARQARAQRKT